MTYSIYMIIFVDDASVIFRIHLCYLLYVLLWISCITVSAVVMWSILNNPTSIIMLYMIIPVPAALFGVLYIGNEVRGLYSGGTGTANIAHLGGVAFGGLYFFRNFKRFMRR